jgi:hypothetical protein
MRWDDQRQSDNVEDRRHEGGVSSAGGVSPLLRLLPMLLGRRGGKFGTVIILGIMAASYFGIEIPFLTGAVTGQVGQSSQTSNRVEPSAEEQRLAKFVSVVLADTEETWHSIFKQAGRRYEEPKLVLFSGSINSACGFAQSAIGPFYCPGDRKVYIDLSFYRDLKQRHGAPGDFAQAYVIAHEVGHHVQTLTGISEKVHKAKQSTNEVGANQLSVRQELQADCFAGIWAHYADKARNLLDEGDIDEALNAAAAIGDDRLQQQSRGKVSPDSFTHGSSAQRTRWFKKGYSEGQFKACDTFSVTKL